MNPMLSLVILVREAGEELNSFLDALGKQSQTERAENVFVVLNPNARDAVSSRLAVYGLTGKIRVSSAEDLGVARREGLLAATGRWVTFPHARDTLSKNYLGSVIAAIDAHSDDADCFVVATSTSPVVSAANVNVVATPLEDDLHGLSADLSRMFLRRTHTPRRGITLSSYADTFLLLDLLAVHGAPRTMHVIHGPQYIRRVMQGNDPQTDVFRSSASNYLELVTTASERLSQSPSPAHPWMKHLILRDIFRLLAFENTTVRRSTVLNGAAGDEFRSQLQKLLSQFDNSFFVRRGREHAFDERRDKLLALAGRDVSGDDAHIVDFDEKSQLMQVRHTQPLAESREQFSLGGVRIQPTYTKRRVLEAFAAPLVAQRIAWVPADGNLRITFGEKEVTLRDPRGREIPPMTGVRALDREWRRATIQSRLEPSDEVKTAETGPTILRWLRGAFKNARRTWLSKAAFVHLLAHLPPFAAKFRRAWLLMDRADMGGDNAEHMYRWLRDNQPQLNTWFALRADSPDFPRLQAEGFRMVKYGTISHQILLHRTVQYLSSHVGIDVSRPIYDRYLIDTPPWTFTFLQHGVIHNDLSIWLNRQRVRLFVTTTPQEHAAISGDNSPYVFTEREVRLTGLPRYDRLRQVADRNPFEKRRSIVIAPTWRSSLFYPPTRSGEGRVAKPGLRDSAFIRSVLSVLNDSRLHELSTRGYKIIFLPHPNLAGHFPYSDVPPFVSVSTYDSCDVQELIGSAKVFLTDYSSVAFDAAFADASVVYMQLDDGAIYGVDHTLFPGYFDFERDGFGPVCHTAENAVRAVIDSVRDGRADEYIRRSQQAFPYRDTSARKRVYDAITRLPDS